MTMHVKGIGLKFPDGTEQTTAAVGGSGDGTGGSGVYTKDETDVLLSSKANVGVSYTKAEADVLVNGKADVGVSYTKAETEVRLATKADISDLERAVPMGTIVMWYGTEAAVNPGWAVCNGENGTPDLRDRFVMGAGTTYTTGSTGGSKDAVIVSHTHTASTNTTGAHTHSLSGSTNTTGNHAHSISTASGKGNYQSSGYSATVYTTKATAATTTTGNHSHSVSGTANSNGNHTHSVTVNANGTSGTGKNLPPYTALFYIMKIT